MTRLTLLAVATLFATSTVICQETLSADKSKEPVAATAVTPAPIARHRTATLSLVGGYAIDMHSASDITLPDVPTCCVGYNGATGGGIVGGLGAELPLSEKLELVTRLTYHATSVTQTTNEPITVRNGNTTQEATIAHELTSQMSIVSLEPSVMFRITPSFGVYCGLRLGTLLGASYTQIERLDDAIAYDYSDGSGTRNASDGTINQTNAFQFGLLVGARYALPLNNDGTMSLVPEIAYSPLFTSVLSTGTWSINSLRLLVGFSYNLMSSESEASPLRPK